jgi:hypothetical protein
VHNDRWGNVDDMIEASLLALLKMKVNLDDIERFSSYTLLSPLQNQSVSAVQENKTLFVMKSVKNIKKCVGRICFLKFKLGMCNTNSVSSSFFL